VDPIVIREILKKESDGFDLSIFEKYKILLKNAVEILTNEEIEEAFANSVRKKLKDNGVQDDIKEYTQSDFLSEEQIDDLLSISVKEALQEIKDKKFHKLLEPFVNKIYDLGIAFYEDGNIIKAEFGSEDDI
jgi:hypothetical protein